MQRRIGLLMVLASAVEFSFMAVAGRYALLSGASPATLMLIRYGVGSLCVGLLWSVRPYPRPSSQVGRKLVLWGGGLYLVRSFCFFTALSLMSASLASLLLYTYPAMVALASAALFGERLSPPKLVAVVLACLGVTLTVGPLSGGNPAGVAFALGAAVAYTAYLLTCSKLTQRASSVPAGWLIMTGTFIGYAVLAPLQGLQPPNTAPGWTAALVVAACSMVGIVGMLAGMRRTGPVVASTLSVIEPALTTVLAVITFGERLGPVQLLGGSLILVAAFMLARLEPAATPEAVA